MDEMDQMFFHRPNHPFIPRLTRWVRNRHVIRRSQTSSASVSENVDMRYVNTVEVRLEWYFKCAPAALSKHLPLFTVGKGSTLRLYLALTASSVGKWIQTSSYQSVYFLNVYFRIVPLEKLRKMNRAYVLELSLWNVATTSTETRCHNSSLKLGKSLLKPFLTCSNVSWEHAVPVL